MSNSLKIVTEVFKCINGLSSVATFARNSGYNLRGYKNVSLPRPRTTGYGKKSFKYVGSKMWNSLPDNFKDFNDLNDFKEAVFKNEITDFITVRDCL